MDAITELRRQRTRPPTIGYADGSTNTNLYGLLRRLLAQHGTLSISKFQAQAGIEVDGICGPETWSYLAKRDDSPGERTVQVALREAYSGAREIGGNNRGKWVLKYGKEGLPWCVMFAVWCADPMYDKVPLHPWDGSYWSPRYSSSALVRWGKEKGFMRYSPNTVIVRVYEDGEKECPIRPGCFVVVKGGRTGYKHTAILLDIDGDDIWVVEGNVRPRKWMPWQRDLVRVGKYKASQVVFVQPEN